MVVECILQCSMKHCITSLFSSFGYFVCECLVISVRKPYHELCIRFIYEFTLKTNAQSGKAQSIINLLKALLHI